MIFNENQLGFPTAIKFLRLMEKCHVFSLKYIVEGGDDDEILLTNFMKNYDDISYLENHPEQYSMDKNILLLEWGDGENDYACELKLWTLNNAKFDTQCARVNPEPGVILEFRFFGEPPLINPMET